LLPIAVKLLPPLTKLFARVLGKFVVPGFIKLLTLMFELVADILYLAEPLVDYMKDIFEALDEWWDRNEDVWDRFWKMMKGAVKWIGDQFDKLWELIKKGASAVKDIFTEIVDAIGDVIDELEKMFKKALEGAKKVPVIGDVLSLLGAAKGEYIEQEAIRVVGEAGPEWIVPDTPQGIMQYVPQMMASVTSQPTAATTKATADALTGQATVKTEKTSTPDRILGEIRDVLKSIELLLQTDTNFLPENL
jgi:hypothetical protein